MKAFCTVVLLFGCLTLSAQPRMVKDITPAGASSYGSGAGRFTYFKGYTYFLADDGTHGYELFRMNMATGEVGLFLDAEPGASSGGANFITVADEKMFFATSGRLWVTRRSIPISSTLLLSKLTAAGVGV